MRERQDSLHGRDFTEKRQDTDWFIRYPRNGTLNIEETRLKWQRFSGFKIEVVMSEHDIKFVFDREHPIKGGDN